MLTDPRDAVLAVSRLAGAALALQTIELLAVRRVAADDGVWPLEIVRCDFDVFPRSVRWLLDRLLAYRVFVALLAVRLVAALTLLVAPHAAAVLFLLASQVLIALRWRGSFNGGSDFMTLIVLVGLAVATAWPGARAAAVACLWYLALNACNSYFLAGLVKLRAPDWRSGAALARFLRATIYAAPPVPAALLDRAALLRAAASLVIAFECAFPLALTGPRACVALVALALSFHLANAFAFGLNRFVLAWAATYPALLYCSQAWA